MYCSCHVVHSYIFVGIAIILLMFILFVTRYYLKQLNTLNEKCKDVSIQTETNADFEYTICIHPNEEVSISRNQE
jgi:hypothetical protein